VNLPTAVPSDLVLILDDLIMSPIPDFEGFLDSAFDFSFWDGDPEYRKNAKIHSAWEKARSSDDIVFEYVHRTTTIGGPLHFLLVCRDEKELRDRLTIASVMAS